jgi:hypothetical protein
MSRQLHQGASGTDLRAPPPRHTAVASGTGRRQGNTTACAARGRITRARSRAARSLAITGRSIAADAIARGTIAGPPPAARAQDPDRSSQPVPDTQTSPRQPSAPPRTCNPPIPRRRPRISTPRPYRGWPSPQLGMSWLAPRAMNRSTPAVATRRLVWLFMAGRLAAIREPSHQDEAPRDLVRARADVRDDLIRARHRLRKMLLRHDIRFKDTTGLEVRTPRGWVAKLDLGEQGTQPTLSDYVGASDTVALRRDTLEAKIAELVPAGRWRRRVPATTLPARDRHAVRSPGTHDSGWTSCGADSTSNAASAKRSSRSPSPGAAPAADERSSMQTPIP